MTVKIDDYAAARIAGVQGHPEQDEFLRYTIVHWEPIDIEDVTIHLENAESGRTLHVDKIVVNGTTYETEAPTTYSTGYMSNGNCLSGNFQIEALDCEGYFQYAYAPVIQRVTYGIAGQTIAVRVSGDPVAGNNGLHYLYSDHLGSTSAMQKDGTTDIIRTRHLPFGGYRSSSGGNPMTDRGYTGHKHNDDLGLIYMNARYYVPEIARFASADTIVPDPTSPQSHNRYSYVLNSPLNLVDPNGHCGKIAVNNGNEETMVRDIANDGLCWSIFDDLDKFMQENPDYAEAYRWADKRADAEDQSWKSLSIMRSQNWKRSQMPRSCWPGNSGNCSQSVAYEYIGSAVDSAFDLIFPDFDGSDALAIGVSLNGDKLIRNGVGGAEIVINWTSKEVSLFLFGGGGLSFGEGANGAIYVAEINNLPNNEAYKGPFIVSDLTVSAGPYGVTRGVFSAPEYIIDPTGTNGNFIGYAPGFNLSAGSGSTVWYTPPLLTYQWGG